MLKKSMFCSIILSFFVLSQGWAEEKIGDCLACHQKETRGIFHSWVNSKHAQKGVDCVTCHKSHEDAKPKKSAVEPKVCAKCHREKYDQFQNGRHSIAWNSMKDHPQYQALPDPLRKAF
jgi:predicted CXXCH cytochrome family protein